MGGGWLTYFLNLLGMGAGSAAASTGGPISGVFSCDPVLAGRFASDGPVVDGVFTSDGPVVSGVFASGGS